MLVRGPCRGIHLQNRIQYSDISHTDWFTMNATLPSCKRVIVTTLASAAVLSGLAFGAAPASAASSDSPVTAASAASNVDASFAIDPGQQFTAGTAATITGTSAPGTKVLVGRLPGSTPEKWTTTRADGSWAVTTDGAAQERFTVIAAGLPDASGGLTASKTADVLPSEEAGDDVAIVVDPVRFTPGERMYITGTAAPGVDLVVEGIPTDTSQGFPIGLNGARTESNGSFTAGGLRAPDVDTFDFTVRLGGQTVTATAVSTTKVDRFRSVALDSTTFAAGAVATITGTATPGATVMIWAEDDWSLFPTVTTTADANGRWSLTGRGAMPEAQSFKVVARQLHSVLNEDIRLHLDAE